VVTPLEISAISRIVIPCPIALLVAIAISVSIVVLLIVIARLSRVVGIADSHEFIKGSASGEHGGGKEYGNQFHDNFLLLQRQPRHGGKDPLGITKPLIKIYLCGL
jgi:hypothetical protein